MLSQYNSATLECNIPRSFNTERSQDNSQHAPVIALYSTSADDRETIFYLFVLQEIREDPKKIQYPVVDFLDIGQPPQSESQKERKDKSFWEEKNKP